MTDCLTLSNQIQERFGTLIQSSQIAVGELTIEVAPANILEVCHALRDEAAFHFEMLMDLTGVDYSEYGLSEWETTRATTQGFSRGVSDDPEIKVKGWDKPDIEVTHWAKPRFAAVYHLLSLKHNHRIRLRTFALGDPPIVPSVLEIWSSANWYEREAFDLFGILFDGHPDLRRLLTDYGFIGHPFRKDFPLIGNVEMRYSAQEKRVVYEAVSIEPRTLVPKTIPKDNRYLGERRANDADTDGAQATTQGNQHG
jgi:NADH-quinone oxidoreductase subunit C